MLPKALQESRKFDKGWVIPCVAETDSEVLVPDSHRHLRLIFRPREQDAGVVNLTGQVLTDHLFRGLHWSDEEGYAVYPVNARLYLVGAAQCQPYYVLKEDARIRLLYDFVDNQLLVWRVSDLQL